MNASAQHHLESIEGARQLRTKARAFVSGETSAACDKKENRMQKKY